MNDLIYRVGVCRKGEHTYGDTLRNLSSAEVPVEMITVLFHLFDFTIEFYHYQWRNYYCDDSYERAIGTVALPSI